MSPNRSPLPKHKTTPRRKRGGQAGNQNARKLGTYSLHKPGPLAHIPRESRQLVDDFYNGRASSGEVRARIYELLAELELDRPSSPRETASNGRLALQLIKSRMKVHGALMPSILRRQALEQIAQDPFSYFDRWYRRHGIGRDGDSFFPVSKNSARNSPLPPGHPLLATNLTDEGWAVLAPLIPPDSIDCEDPAAEPPVIIAASRWSLQRYYPEGDFADFVIMERYREVLQRLPASPPLTSPGPRRGRPFNREACPRALLDAILWKLATGHPWDALPSAFPPLRCCRKYYRRLFLSGRFYTLMQALYNHMRIALSVDPSLMLQAGLFTTTPSQHIALAPGAPPASRNYTALLFMQLARTAYTYFDREYKRFNPDFCLMPVFKGNASLSTGLPEGSSFNLIR